MAAMGIGALGAPGVIIKRKFRWVFAMSTPCGNIPGIYCRSASRPSLEVESTQIDFLNATTWVPGKGRWQPITVSFIDVADIQMQGLYNWIATVYNFTDPVGLSQGEKADWNGTAFLNMLDGCGNVLETWGLGSCFPTSINFGDLSYESSDLATIELTLKFSEVSYVSNCGVKQISPCCTGCG